MCIYKYIYIYMYTHVYVCLYRDVQKMYIHAGTSSHARISSRCVYKNTACHKQDKRSLHIYIYGQTIINTYECIYIYIYIQMKSYLYSFMYSYIYIYIYSSWTTCQYTQGQTLMQSFSVVVFAIVQHATNKTKGICRHIHI